MLKTIARNRDHAAAGMHWLCLLTGVAIMLGITVYPPLLTGSNGKADHGLATLLLLAMSAGFVRGVGFIPRATIPRWLFSGWSCLALLMLTALAFVR